MSTSGTYTFSNLPSDQIIVEAFERIGVVPDVITVEQVNSAQRSANIILRDWMNRGLNLWTLNPIMISLVPGQNVYALPTNTNNIVVANLRRSTRLLGGTPFSSAGGVAGYAFDGDPLTACTQTAPDGYISYNYGLSNFTSVQMVGIQSNVTTTYTLAFEYSNDNITWTTSMLLPPQTFTLGVNQWFIVNIPVPQQYFRVRETGGGTLNIQELYFNNSIQDIPMSELSVTDYWREPYKNQAGQPTCYYIQRDINPLLYIWQTPTLLYNNIFLLTEKLIEDIGQLTNQVQVPSRFYEALISCLAFQLALKYAPERADAAEMRADKTFSRAAAADAQDVPVRIYGNFLSGWTRS